MTEKPVDSEYVNTSETKTPQQPHRSVVNHGRPWLPWKMKAPMLKLLQNDFRQLTESMYLKNPHSSDAARLLTILAAIGDRAFTASGRADKNSLKKSERWNNNSSVVSLYDYEMDLLKIASKVRGSNSNYFRNKGLQEILESDLSDPNVIQEIIQKWCVDN